MKFPTVIPGFKKILHGGDYNPDQWRDYPEIIDEDFRLMKMAHCNAFSVGIFAWSTLEPEDGVYNFDWLDDIMNRMADAGQKVFLATPSGAKPVWLSLKYPEIRRVGREGIREGHAGRHNNCNSSPVYRKYVARINSKLAERYANHPALGGFHISNEYDALPCYCEYCTTNFRKWLEKRYGTIENLNRRLWTSFWGHAYTSFDQIDGYDYYTLDGLAVDFKRFLSDLQADFLKHEIDAVRQYSSAPVTTNMMGYHETIDYWRIARNCDFISDDCYPLWNDPDATSECADVLCSRHDMHRAMKNGKPFVMLESTPSTVNWANISRLKRPGVHLAEMLCAVAHGADGTMYFQWRKGRGGLEKYHGAVVGHDFSSDTRVFKDVENVGEVLEKLADVAGSTVAADCAIIFDWDVRWAVNASQGLTSQRDYYGTFVSHYRALSRNHAAIDVIESDCDFSKYKLISAPMLYMLKDGVADRLAEFVRNGGTLVGTYFTGYVNADNMCFMNGMPGGGLVDVFGVRVEEFDGFSEKDTQGMIMSDGVCHKVSSLAERFRVLPGAAVIGRYANDFYAGEPAAVSNVYGKGKGYYLGARTDLAMLEKFYCELIDEAHVLRQLPRGSSGDVHASIRTDGGKSWLFIFNFGKNEAEYIHPSGFSTTDIITHKDSDCTLKSFETRVFRSI